MAIKKLLALFSILICGFPTAAFAQDQRLQSSLIESSLLEWRTEVDSSLILQSDTSLSLEAMRASPRIANSEDLAAFLAPAHSLAESSTNVFDLMQEVPGLPEDERYQTPRYREVIDSFSEACIDAATSLNNALVETIADESLFRQRFTNSFIPATSAYDLNCFTSLNQIPIEIRNITGVLVKDRVPFCSATIIGEDRMLTSRHCFIDADSGADLRFTALTRGAITFHSFSQTAGNKVYPVRTVTQEVDQSLFQPFDVADDYIVLRTIGFPSIAYPDRVSITPNDPSLPIPVWVVGSNELLGSLSGGGSVMSTVRASGPKACSILEVTEKGCIYHSCQTGPSTSGATLMRTDENGGISILGVHKAPISRGKTCENQPPVNLKLNLATVLPTTDILED